MTREEFIARIRYLGWICFQMGADLPLHDVPDDFSISDERLQGLIDGTIWAIEHPEATPEENHQSWMNSKIKQGYVYGDKIDVINKKHPSLVPFDQLSKTEQDKDYMDLLMVKLANQLYEQINSSKSIP